MTTQLGFSFIAGLLTTLSPCVLPILPFLLGSAVRKNKKAPLYMVLGLAATFVLVGFTLSRFGTLLGLDSEEIKKASAVVLILTSAFFLFKNLQEWISNRLTTLAGLSSSASRKWQLDESSSWDSVLIGCLLGVLWAPCTGPTLGVAVSLASQEGAALDALTIMLIYSVGAALPMLLIAYGLRTVFQKHQKNILYFADRSKIFFGVILLLTGIFVFFGFDKSLETFLLNHLPDAWVDLITRY